jgi:acetyl esterase
VAVADLEALAGRGLAALPPRVQRALSGRPPRVLDGQVLEPGIQLLLRVMALRGSPVLISGPDADPVAVRAQMLRDARAAAGRHPTPVGAVTDVIIDGGDGPLVARHYTPSQPTGAPLLVFFHGGGWVIGGLESHDEPCRVLCRDGGAHVLAVDYRLAPEHPFPAGVEDAVAATRWALAHAAELGADPSRVAVGGDSAGGNLAAVASLALARAGGPVPALQALIYPGTDAAQESRSRRLFGDGFLLDRVSIEWFKALYIPAGVDRRDPRLSPIYAKDLSGLPPAVVVTAAFDPLRDEGAAYAAALRDAGNRVVEHCAVGLIHGFINLTAVNRRAREETSALARTIAAELS